MMVVAGDEGAQGTPSKGASTRIARVALEALAFPSKWTGFGGLSAQVSAAKPSTLHCRSRARLTHRQLRARRPSRSGSTGSRPG